MNKSIDLGFLNKLSLSHIISEMLILLVDIPLILILIYYSWLNESFTLYLSNPTLFTIYSSNFAHLNPTHLWDNIVSYLVLMLLIIPLQKSRKFFYLNMGIIFLTIPFFVYVITNLCWNVKTSLGFSGIVAALLAYFLFSASVKLDEMLKIRLS